MATRGRVPKAVKDVEFWAVQWWQESGESENSHFGRVAAKLNGMWAGLKASGEDRAAEVCEFLWDIAIARMVPHSLPVPKQGDFATAGGAG